MLTKKQLVVGKPAHRETPGYNRPVNIEHALDSIKETTGGIMIWSITFDKYAGYPLLNMLLNH